VAAELDFQFEEMFFVWSRKSPGPVSVTLFSLTREENKKPMYSRIVITKMEYIPE